MTLVTFNLSLLFELSAITDSSMFVEPGQDIADAHDDLELHCPPMSEHPFSRDTANIISP